jgi:hypothetical protein
MRSAKAPARDTKSPKRQKLAGIGRDARATRAPYISRRYSSALSNVAESA